MFVNYTLIFITMMFFAGLAVDAGVLEMRYLSVQGAAQAAAQAAALVKNENQYFTWSTVGQNAAAANGFQNGINGVTVTLQNPPATGGYAGNGSAYMATVSQTVNTAFLGLVGLSRVTMSAQALSVASAYVTLSSAFNIYATFTDSTAVTNNGFDTANYAFSANALGHQFNGTNNGSRLSWHGQIFYTGAPNGKNGVSNATVTLPSGNYSQLLILASTAFGPYSNASFVVNYSGGSTTTATFTMSDWCSPHNYPGESIAVQSAYRLYQNSGANGYSTYIYGYTINLDNTKTLSSVTLPACRNVVVFAMNVMP